MNKKEDIEMIESGIRDRDERIAAEATRLLTLGIDAAAEEARFALIELSSRNLTLTRETELNLTVAAVADIFSGVNS